MQLNLQAGKVPSACEPSYGLARYGKKGCYVRSLLVIDACG